MSIAGIALGTILAIVVLAVLRGRSRGTALGRSLGLSIVVVALVPTIALVAGQGAEAVIVSSVGLGTASGYSVLGGQSVTNTGPSLLPTKLGVWPGTSITGFPPGIALGTTEAGSAPAAQAQADALTAYNDAAGRPLDGNTPADLAGLTLLGGVYATSNQGALSLNGTLVLDGANDPNSVFIFQTDSSLIIGGGSTVALINGAQECNVFWQVGSSATLGGGASIAGTVLALTSISAISGVSVRGRLIAANGSVTLDTDSFSSPSCAQGPSPTTTTTTDAGSTTTTTDAGSTTTATPGSTTTTSIPGSTTTTTASGSTTTTSAPGSTSTTTVAGSTSTTLAGSTTTTAAGSTTTVAGSTTTVAGTTTTIPSPTTVTTSAPTTIAAPVTTIAGPTTTFGVTTTDVSQTTSGGSVTTAGGTVTTVATPVTTVISPITVAGATTTTLGRGIVLATTVPAAAVTTTIVTGPTLPHTGQAVGNSILLAFISFVLGLIALSASRRRVAP